MSGVDGKSGVFDTTKKEDIRPPENPTTVKPIKQDFKSVNQQLHVQNVEKSKRAGDRAKLESDAATSSADKINAAMGSGNDADKMGKELDELIKISPEDMKSAEEIIFQGYTERDIKHHQFEKMIITIVSMTPEDFSVIEEMVWDYVKANEKDDGTIDLPDYNVRTKRSMYSLALSYKGMNHNELCDNPICHLNVIKRAIKKLSDLEADGDIDNFKKLNEDIKKSIKKRAAELRKMPTPVIDFISNEKSKFEEKMYAVMNRENIVPKS